MNKNNQPTEHEPMYYLRSKERGFLGNSPVWWGKNRCGYTAYLDQAGKYTKPEAEEICRNASGQESMHLCSEVDSMSHTCFDWQDSGKLTRCEDWQNG